MSQAAEVRSFRVDLLSFIVKGRVNRRFVLARPKVLLKTCLKFMAVCSFGVSIS